MRDWAAERLIHALDVVPSRDSNVINIDVTAENPVVAAKRANAFADSYIQADLDLKTEPERRQATWFQEQVKDLRVAVELARSRLSDYQRLSGLAGTDDKDSRLDVENARFAEISTQLVAAQSSLADARSRLNQVAEARGRGQLDQIPDLLNSLSLLQTLKADLAHAEANFADVSERYGRNAPPYRSAAAQVEADKAKVASELDTVIGSIRQTAEISQQRINELQHTLDAQKARILQLKQTRCAVGSRPRCRQCTKELRLGRATCGICEIAEPLRSGPRRYPQCGHTTAQSVAPQADPPPCWPASCSAGCWDSRLPCWLSWSIGACTRSRTWWRCRMSWYWPRYRVS